jgi:hypothetical protein
MRMFEAILKNQHRHSERSKEYLSFYFSLIHLLTFLKEEILWTKVLEMTRTSEWYYSECKGRIYVFIRLHDTVDGKDFSPFTSYLFTVRAIYELSLLTFCLFKKEIIQTKVPRKMTGKGKVIKILTALLL